MPRVLVWAFGALGSAILTRVVTRLMRRVERELD
jgi:hypothetical protein